MKDNQDIVIDGLMARIRELELDVANRDFAIKMMSNFLEMKDENHPLTQNGTNLKENFINYTFEEYDNDGIYDSPLRLNPDEVEHSMMSHFRGYKTNDERTQNALSAYLSREGLRK